MNNKGFTLLLAIITTSIMLVISFVVTNVAFKQLVLSHAMRESQIAFYAADAGTECAVYWDLKNSTSAFSTSTDGSIVCSGMTIDNISNIQTVPTYPVASMIGGGGNSNPTSTFTLTFPTGCAIVQIGKHTDGTTIIDSRGYNNCNTSAPKRYERGVTLRFDNGGYLGGNGNVPTSPTLSTDISTVAPGGSLNVSWTNISSIPGNPKSTDWIALYPVGAGSDLSYVANSGIYAGTCTSTSGSAPSSAGTCAFTIPNGTSAGSYYLMMLDQLPTNGGSQVAIAATPNIAVSNALTGHIVLTPSSLSFSSATNVTPSGKTVALQNTGTGTLSWTASPNQTWCHISPASGSLASGVSTNLSVTVDSRSSVGTYNCNIIVNSTTADNSPQTISVTYTVSSGYACATASGSYQDLSTGNYKIYKFTSGSGNSLNVTCSGAIEYLIVGGGGGGGHASGGGGGGGRVITGSTVISNGNYTISVGAGGPGSVRGSGVMTATAGSSSSFNGLTAAGGGGGGVDEFSGGTGASGGGGGGYISASTPPYTIAGGVGSFGGNGGTGSRTTGSHANGGGGGGAGGVGQNASTVKGGNGGAGVTSSISGVPIDYGGGGGGGANGSVGDTFGTGNDGGGNGSAGNAGNAGTANTGGGGGGASANLGNGGAGGSGVVIIKFQFQ